MPEFRFAPECHADTTLVRFLLKNDSRIIHATGYPNVGEIMRKAPNGSIIIGFVDDDKRTPPYFDDFDIIDIDDKVVFKKKRDQERYLIVVQKAIETFIIWNAEQAGVDMEKHGFSTDFKELAIQIKTLTVENDPNFHSLLTDLDNQNAPGFVRIKAILNELVK